MFTGIIEEIGKIEKIKKDSQFCTLEIKASKVLEDISLGDSISVNGICLTVTSFNHQIFKVDVMNETWDRTALAKLKPGSLINLERALLVNDRLGGHLVTGHIDGTGIIKSIQKDSNAVWYQITAHQKILSLIVEKGSIAIDGISLTVAKVSRTDFWVSVIPHTLQQTILKNKHINDTVNLENWKNRSERNGLSFKPEHVSLKTVHFSTHN
ncbi:riboflavin synthase [Dubosiella newyorkensis]|uniref:riboflavin synthase n=1 Tax=Dubosiella newyorkensis TaxID=1862672 RepID=UPI0027295636|nr:riboflavin synthase [Dubosiella newyorkensis]